MTYRGTIFVVQVATFFVATHSHGQTPEKPQVGSVQLGFGHAGLSGNYPAWRDAFVRGNVRLGEEQGVVNWEVSKQKHFGESGQALSLSLTRDLSSSMYGSVGFGVGSGAGFLPKNRVDIALYRKWLERKQWVTGLQYTASRSGDEKYRDRAWQISSSYYFFAPLVAQIGVTHNTSMPGNVGTYRAYLTATYGENKKYYLTARFDTGHEGYLPQGANVAATDFKSNVAALTWRQWWSSQMGHELQLERYANPFYDRNAIAVSWFYDF
ncbi:MAG: YaiO family outer membrane beta-barrel protein [Burkholderiaceae bacterium]